MKTKYLPKSDIPRRLYRRKSGKNHKIAAKTDAQHDDLLESTVRDPGKLTVAITTTNGTMRARIIQRLQQERGNIYVQRVLAALTPMHDSSPVIQRQQGKKRKAPSPATTTIGPPRTSTYSIQGKSLAEVATDYASRDEAGSVEWEPHYDYQISPTTGKIISATVTVPLNVTLPVWNAPAGTGPKTKAEWTRAREALKAHEDGHIKLVRKHFGGFANKVIGKTPEEAQTLLDETSANLQQESDDHDVKTDHGRNTGTVIDTSIEEKEQEDAAKNRTQKK